MPAPRSRNPVPPDPPAVLAAALAFLVAYAPTYVRLAAGPWQTDQDGHGGFIVAASAWLAWRHLSEAARPGSAPAPVAGWICLAFGLVPMILGRSQSLLGIEVASQIPVLAGLVLVFGGRAALRAVALPLVLLAFSVPIPGWVLDPLTVPLKVAVSDLVCDLLYGLGFPIAQNGVMLTVGPYVLQVKDACAGMNSIFSLSAISLLYIALSRPPGLLHRAVLYAMILPVSFLANAIRIVLLVVVTYEFGEAAGEGVFHQLTGIVLFMAAVGCILLVDGVLRAAGSLFGRPRPVRATA